MRRSSGGVAACVRDRRAAACDWRAEIEGHAIEERAVIRYVRASQVLPRDIQCGGKRRAGDGGRITIVSRRRLDRVR